MHCDLHHQILLIAGLDYDSRSQQVTIPASTGPSETCFNVGIVDDSNVESDEEFLVSFLIPPGSNAQPGAVSSTCITITDNDEGREPHMNATIYNFSLIS